MLVRVGWPGQVDHLGLLLASQISCELGDGVPKSGYLDRALGCASIGLWVLH